MLNSHVLCGTLDPQACLPN